MIFYKVLDYYDGVCKNTAFFEQKLLSHHMKMLKKHCHQINFAGTINGELAKAIFKQEFFRDIIIEIYEKNQMSFAKKDKIRQLVEEYRSCDDVEEETAEGDSKEIYY